MDVNMQVHEVTQQSAHQSPVSDDMAVRPDGAKSNTSLIEIQDKVHLSPEGRALLARMEEAQASDA